MGGRCPKQYLMLAGQPVIAHTLARMAGCKLVERIVLVLPKDDLEYCRRNILPLLAVTIPVKLVGGGAERQASVYEGLKALIPYQGVVVIHDGVRPLISPSIVRDCILTAQVQGACITALPATDTLKQSRPAAEGGFSDPKLPQPSEVVSKTLARQHIWLAQTPQAFDFELILKAHQHALQHARQATDDAMLLEELGQPVYIIYGSRTNLKITLPEDLVLAEALLRYHDPLHHGLSEKPYGPPL